MTAALDSVCLARGLCGRTTVRDVCAERVRPRCAGRSVTQPDTHPGQTSERGKQKSYASVSLSSPALPGLQSLTVRGKDDRPRSGAVWLAVSARLSDGSTLLTSVRNRSVHMNSPA